LFYKLISLSVQIKTVIIMAKFELKVLDLVNEEDFINVVYEKSNN
jgi:hypothetical protein